MNGCQESPMCEDVLDVNLITLIESKKVKKIPLTQGKFAIVDVENYERIARFKWYATKSQRNYTFYADRAFYTNERKGDRLILLMRRLDNRKTNLREITPTLNNHNSRLRKSNVSGYRGVCWNKSLNLWAIQLFKSKKLVCLSIALTSLING